MPFTAAHSMAVLPLAGRWRLDTTCLVIGAMAPDFEYFVRVKQASSISHTWIGLLVWNIPITLLLAIAFHRIVKWPLVLVAPRVIARRAAVYADRPWPEAWSWRFVVACVISAAIGALTHLVWDGFTHSDGMITPHVPALRTLIDLPFVAKDLVLHRVLQHASTVIGSLVLFIVVARRLYRTAPIELPDRPRVWPRLAALACLTVGLGLSVLRLAMGRRTDDIGNIVVILISGGLAGVLIASLVLRRTALRTRRMAS